MLNAYSLREARQRTLMERRWEQRANAYLNALTYIGIGATSRENKPHYYDLRAPIVAFGSSRVIALFDQYVDAFEGITIAKDADRADALERELEQAMNGELTTGARLLR
jgi:hypothetical protein